MKEQELKTFKHYLELNNITDPEILLNHPGDYKPLYCFSCGTVLGNITIPRHFISCPHCKSVWEKHGIKWNFSLSINIISSVLRGNPLMGAWEKKYLEPFIHHTFTNFLQACHNDPNYLDQWLAVKPTSSKGDPTEKKTKADMATVLDVNDIIG